MTEQNKPLEDSEKKVPEGGKLIQQPEGGKNPLAIRSEVVDTVREQAGTKLTTFVEGQKQKTQGKVWEFEQQVGLGLDHAKPKNGATEKLRQFIAGNGAIPLTVFLEDLKANALGRLQNLSAVSKAIRSTEKTRQAVAKRAGFNEEEKGQYMLSLPVDSIEEAERFFADVIDRIPEAAAAIKEALKGTMSRYAAAKIVKEQLAKDEVFGKVFEDFLEEMAQGEALFEFLHAHQGAEKGNARIQAFLRSMSERFEDFAKQKGVRDVQRTIASSVLLDTLRSLCQKTVDLTDDSIAGALGKKVSEDKLALFKADRSAFFRSLQGTKKNLSVARVEVNYAQGMPFAFNPEQMTAQDKAKLEQTAKDAIGVSVITFSAMRKMLEHLTPGSAVVGSVLTDKNGPKPIKIEGLSGPGVVISGEGAVALGFADGKSYLLSKNLAKVNLGKSAADLEVASPDLVKKLFSRISPDARIVCEPVAQTPEKITEGTQSGVQAVLEVPKSTEIPEVEDAVGDEAEGAEEAVAAPVLAEVTQDAVTAELQRLSIQEQQEIRDYVAHGTTEDEKEAHRMDCMNHYGVSIEVIRQLTE